MVGLQPTSFDKSAWKVWVKDYMKAVLEKIDDKRKPIFKAGMPAIVKKFLDEKEIWEHGGFYTGVCMHVVCLYVCMLTWRMQESMNPDGMVIISLYREDGITPYFIFFKVRTNNYYVCGLMLLYVCLYVRC
jgi:hypothetical protein